MDDILNSSKPISYSKIAAYVIADALSVSITLAGGYIYFIAFRKVSPLVKIPIMMIGNRLLVTSLHEGEKLINNFKTNLKA